MGKVPLDDAEAFLRVKSVGVAEKDAFVAGADRYREAAY